MNRQSSDSIIVRVPEKMKNLQIFHSLLPPLLSYRNKIIILIEKRERKKKVNITFIYLRQNSKFRVQLCIGTVTGKKKLKNFTKLKNCRLSDFEQYARVVKDNFVCTCLYKDIFISNCFFPL